MTEARRSDGGVQYKRIANFGKEDHHFFELDFSVYFLLIYGNIVAFKAEPFSNIYE